MRPKSLKRTCWSPGVSSPLFISDQALFLTFLDGDFQELALLGVEASCFRMLGENTTLRVQLPDSLDLSNTDCTSFGPELATGGYTVTPRGMMHGALTWG